MTTAFHDPGGKQRIALPEGVKGGAIFSGGARIYRQALTRHWGNGRRYAVWVGMNPSVADEHHDDPTVRAEWLYTRDRLGLDFYVKVNVMDYRKTASKALRELHLSGTVLSSTPNLPEILNQVAGADRVVLTFGSLHRSLRPYAAEVVRALEAKGIPLWCIKVNADGCSPRHSSRGYLNDRTELQAYPCGIYPGSP